MVKRVHCVGVNEPSLANLAITLQGHGYEVTSSVEVTIKPYITDLLSQNHLLPTTSGPSITNIHNNLDALIIGREINLSNIEVEAAKKLAIPVYTYTEYISHYAQHKQRIVILGDENIIAPLFSIVVHILSYLSRSFDYVTSFANWPIKVKLSDAPVIFLQADSAPASILDERVQFLAYQPHIAVMHGLGPVDSQKNDTLKGYLNLLNQVADGLPKAGSLFYNAGVTEIKKIGDKHRVDVKNIPYYPHPTKVNNKQIYLVSTQSNIPIPNISKQNLEAIAAAKALLSELSVTTTQFYEAIASFDFGNL